MTLTQLSAFVLAATSEMPVLVANRLADLALGPDLSAPGADTELVSEAVFRCKMVAVASPADPLRGPPSSWPWLAETAATPMEATWYATCLPRGLRAGVATSLRQFLTTPEAMHLMPAPHGGVAPAAFRPPVYVTIRS